MTGKLLRRAIRERTKLLIESDLTVTVEGRTLKPGTREYERRIRSLAETLSMEEVRAMVAGGKGGFFSA